MKTPLYHLPLEPLKERYTEFLYEWELSAFRDAGFKVAQFLPVDKERPVMSISSGEVLDAVNRPIWSFDQLSQLLEQMNGAGKSVPKIYFSDFFTPGLEGLPYTRMPFEAYSFLWAQTFDQYDFTSKMIQWMRPWEHMALQIYSKVFVASDLLKELIVTAAPDVADRIEVVGLPFNSESVGAIWDKKFARGEEIDCIYSSRWDAEKNPEMFLDLVETCGDLSFAISTPYPELHGTAVNSIVMDRIDSLKNLTVHTGMTKPQYYALLNASKVQFNCALQDWVSFTLLEALTYDCLPLYPAFRSFPETFDYEEAFLYRPFDVVSAAAKLNALLESDTKPPQHILDYHDGTLSRIANSIVSN